MGWGQHISLAWDAGRRAHHTQQSLLPGRYQYKLIFDGRWSFDADHPLLEVGLPITNCWCALSLMFMPGLLAERCCCCAQDGGNVNNFIDVPRDSAHAAECKRCAAG